MLFILGLLQAIWKSGKRSSCVRSVWRDAWQRSGQWVGHWNGEIGAAKNTYLENLGIRSIFLGNGKRLVLGVSSWWKLTATGFPGIESPIIRQHHPWYLTMFGWICMIDRMELRWWRSWRNRQNCCGWSLMAIFIDGKDSNSKKYMLPQNTLDITLW